MQELTPAEDLAEAIERSEASGYARGTNLTVEGMQALGDLLHICMAAGADPRSRTVDRLLSETSRAVLSSLAAVVAAEAGTPDGEAEMVDRAITALRDALATAQETR